MRHFVFDKEHMKFRPRKMGIKGILTTFVKYLLMSLVVAVGCYLFMALIFSTDREKKLIAENRRMKEECTQLQQKMVLVDQVVDNLSERDRAIYREVFNAEIPQLAGEGGPDSLYVDWSRMNEFSDKELVSNTAKTAKSLEYSVNKVNYWIAVANQALADKGARPTAIPSIVPMKNFETLQTGASVGKRMNPFFKTMKDHTGIDLMAPVGTEVICTADGVVSLSEKTDKGLGNRVEITHSNGFVTKYMHLGEIKPSKGQRVSQGDVIGKVGLSGSSFASCLHYEVWKGGKCLDPASFFFAELNPVTYSETMTIGQTTGQSMD